jgi:hypothetical protein
MSSETGDGPSWRSSLLTVMRAVTIIAGLATLLSTMRLQPWDSPRGAGARAGEEIPWTQVNPIGVNTFLGREVEAWKRERTLEMVAATGAGWIKEHFPWRDIETAQDLYWDGDFHQDAWAKYDAIVEAAERHGLRIIARIDFPPAWARPLGSTPTAPPRDYADFGDFIADFVRHYEGRVQFLQIWNEPNLAAEWGGEIDPAAYAELLRVAATAARDVDPNVVILSAPLAMTTENSARAMDDLSYWQALYDAGAAPYFDIMSANAYGLDQPYDAQPSPDRLNIRRIELLREVAVANGDGGKSIWLNEYGWNAAPETFPPEALIWSRTSEDLQAEWTRAGIEFLRDRHNWFGVANTWYFRQVGDISISRADYFFRAVDVEFTPRDLYWALQELGGRLTVAGPGAYNDLAAAVRPYGTWSIVRDRSASAGEYIKGEPDNQLTISFEGNRLTAVLAHGQAATTLIVSENGADSIWQISVKQGQTRVVLYDGARDQAASHHTLRITVAGDEALLLDGVDVAYRRSLWFVGVSGLTFLAALLAYALLRRGGAS